MTTRRSFLIGASTELMCAPAIVRTQSLMQLRGIVLLTERYHFGFTDRLYVHLHLPKIVVLQNAGFSLRSIAADFNQRGMRAINAADWDTQGVTFVITRDKLIRRQDLLLRAEHRLR